jgi:hypothetical protein
VLVEAIKYAAANATKVDLKQESIKSGTKISITESTVAREPEFLKDSVLIKYR